MAAAQPVHRLTEAEYLALERRAESKSEFREGEMFAMAGGSPAHSQIACNLISAINTQLKDSPCVVFNSDMRVKVQMAGLYTYPDVSVLCGREELEDEHDDVLLNPTVVAEVLSDSREAYDRGKKFELYRRLPSLREYLLVNQHEPLIEQFIRQPGGEWLLRDVAGLDGKLTMPSVGITISLADVYSKVRFLPTARLTGAPGRHSPS
jgi:Uma2 family endonuclease